MPQNAPEKLMANPTPKQQEVIDVVRAYRAAHDGATPTMSKMAEIIGINKVSLHERMQALVRKGCIRVAPNQARGTLLAEDFECCPMCGRSMKKEESASNG